MTKRDFLTSSAHLALLTALSLTAAAQTPPAAYSVTQVNSMMGPTVTMKVYRDGSKALIENSYTPEGLLRKPTHTDAHSLTCKPTGTILWDTLIMQPVWCSDWNLQERIVGDPFAGSAIACTPTSSTKKARNVGGPIIGISAKVFEVSNARPGRSKTWLESKIGTAAQASKCRPRRPQAHMIEVKEFSAAKPSAALFVAPAACSQAAAEAYAAHRPRTLRQGDGRRTGGLRQCHTSPRTALAELVHRTLSAR